jgi:hypothetical protein
MPSVRYESGRGNWFSYGFGAGSLGTVISSFGEHFPSDFGHAAGDNRDRIVGAFAPQALLGVEGAKVIGATHRHPSRFDEGLLQPSIAKWQHAPVRDFAA